MSVTNFEFSGLDDMTEKFYFGRKGFTFLYNERDSHILKTCQYIVDVVDMFFDGVRVDDYIV